MSEAVQELLRSFDSLPETEQREAYSEILKRARDIVASSPTHDGSPPLCEEDEELVHLAEMTFLELDAREAADGKP
jgi:hypothetical protein